MAKKSVRKTAGIRKMNPRSLANLKRDAGPGRPKGSKNHDGLQVVLNMLKDLINEKKNVDLLKASMQEAFTKQPLGFYYRFVMPMLPKSIELTPGGDLIVQISPQFMPKVKKPEVEYKKS